MKSLTFQPVLFGLDLRELVQDWSHALQLMAQWPGVRWLTPRDPVQLHWPDGQSQHVIETPGGGSQLLTKVPRGGARYQGRVIHDDHVLWHALSVTGLSGADIEAAVALEAERLSPFASEDTVYTHVLQGGLRPGESIAMIGITARHLLAPYLKPLARPATKGNSQGRSTQKDIPPEADSLLPQTRDTTDTVPELWLELPQALIASQVTDTSLGANSHELQRSRLYLLPGHGEQLRHQRARRWRMLNLLLLVLILSSAALAVLTPSLQLRARVQQAHSDYTALQSQALPAQQAREQLVQWQGKVQQLQKLVGNRLVPEHTLLLLTQYLPDDTYLIVLDIRAQRVEMVGVTPNANALMLHLERQPGVKRVVAINPARREGNREVFSVEFQLDTAAIAAAPTSANQAKP